MFGRRDGENVHQKARTPQPGGENAPAEGENSPAARRYCMLAKRSTALVKLSMVLSASPCWMPSRTQC